MRITLTLTSPSPFSSPSQDECGINANSSDFERLELHTNPFLEKQMQVGTPTLPGMTPHPAICAAS